MIIGLLHRTYALNYLIILGKITIWESRKNKISLNFRLFLHKFEVKKEVEKNNCHKEPKASRFL